MKDRPALSDEEIGQFKDFDTILVNHGSMRRKSAVKKIAFAFSCLVVGCLALLYFYSKNGTKGPQQKKAVENSSKKNQEIRKPLPPVSPKKEEVNDLLKSRKVKQALVAQNGFSEAEPIGGYDSLFAHLERQLIYPEKEKARGVSGSVLVEFYINAEGKPEDIAVVKGEEFSFNEEAMRLIATMPTWKPAQLNGAPISTRHVIPIQFIIHAN